MPINCLVKFWTFRVFRVPKPINGFLMNQFMNINVSKRRFFVFHPFVFGGSAAQNGRLSFFNVRSALPANSLKTKELRKRHFWLKILSQGKPLRLKTLGEKFAQWFVHFPAIPTRHKPPKPPLHAPPRNPAPCKVLCRICQPNPTHPTPLIIKF